MIDFDRLEQAKAEATAAQLGRRIADDVIWWAQTADVPPGTVADTRYTRLLHAMADQLLASLEHEAGAGSASDRCECACSNCSGCLGNLG